MTWSSDYKYLAKVKIVQLASSKDESCSFVFSTSSSLKIKILAYNIACFDRFLTNEKACCMGNYKILYV